jgi:ubiquinone/menaquinone biosynthesis C-methylase UbiE
MDMSIDPELERRSKLMTHIRAGLLHSTKLLRRMLRNQSFKAHSRTHTDFYRAVMASNARRDPDAAIGSDSRKHWLKVGEMQFSYLLKHGLRPDHRILDIGCGNLRAGWRLIQYLDSGNYYGVDISPDILLAALKELRDQRLQHKYPHLVLVNDLKFEFVPDESFDVIHAHSVFTHTRVDAIEQCFASAARLLKPSGFFDLTYLEGDKFSLNDEDFCYPRETLLEIAASHNFDATYMSDWDYSTYMQHKLRLRRRA